MALVRVYRMGGYWYVHQCGLRRPSVQVNTWEQAMRQAEKYVKLLNRREVRAMRRAGRRQ